MPNVIAWIILVLVVVYAISGVAISIYEGRDKK